MWEPGRRKRGPAGAADTPPARRRCSRASACWGRREHLAAAAGPVAGTVASRTAAAQAAKDAALRPAPAPMAQRREQWWARGAVLQLLALGAMLAACTQHRVPGPQHRAPPPRGRRTGAFRGLLTLRLSLCGGGDDGDEISQIRRAMEELKSRRRSASPHSMRGRPAFNATADREMRVKKMLEEQRVRRHERFAQMRDEARHARSRSAPSPSRPPPAARSGSGGGIADFAGSGGWNLTRVSDQIWATGAQAGSKSNNTFLNWSSVVSTATIKTSASADVLSHLRGGGGESEGCDPDSDARETALKARPDAWGENDGEDEEDAKGSDESESSERAWNMDGGTLPPLSDSSVSESASAGGRHRMAAAARRDAGGQDQIMVDEALCGVQEAKELDMHDSSVSDISAAASGGEHAVGGGASDLGGSSPSACAAGGKAQKRGGKEPKEKASLLEKAKAGDIRAQVQVGLGLLSGPPTNRSPQRGLLWLKKAARAGEDFVHACARWWVCFAFRIRLHRRHVSSHIPPASALTSHICCAASAVHQVRLARPTMWR